MSKHFVSSAKTEKTNMQVTCRNTELRGDMKQDDTEVAEAVLYWERLIRCGVVLFWETLQIQKTFLIQLL